MRKIIWSESALGDLRRIEAWLGRERSPEYAVRILAAIRFRCKFLKDFPHSGPPVSADLRKLRVLDTGYIMLYSLTNSATKIVRVFHEREDWQNEI